MIEISYFNRQGFSSKKQTNSKSIILQGQYINLRARQIVYALAVITRPENPKDEIVVSAEDLLHFINSTPGEKWANIHESLQQIFTHLNQNPLLLQDEENQAFTYTNWLSHLEVKDGKIYTQFTPRLSAYLAQQNPNELDIILLEDLQPFKTKFTAAIVRLFETNQAEHERGDIEFSFTYDLGKLKQFFGVGDKYRRFFDFERFVLQATRQELDENDILPYWFSFEKIKQGRNIKDILFTVYRRPRALLDLRPQLRAAQEGSCLQRDIFDEQRAGSFNPIQQDIFKKLTTQFGIGKVFAQKILNNLSLTQAKAYALLIAFGLNKTTAYSLLKKYENNENWKDSEEENINQAIKKVKEKTNRKDILLLERILREGFSKDPL